MVCGLVWNARGIGNKPTLRRLKNFILEHQLAFVVILEPMIDKGAKHAENLQKVRRQCASAMQTLKEWQKYGSSVSYKLILFDSHPQIVTFFIEAMKLINKKHSSHLYTPNALLWSVNTYGHT